VSNSLSQEFIEIYDFQIQEGTIFSSEQLKTGAPICLILVYFTWPWFVDSWRIHETSSNAGGLIRWPVKLVLPVGFALMALQGISELIKRIEALMHHHRLQFEYEKPLQ